MNAGALLHPVVVPASVRTAVAAADDGDNARLYDVVASHPGHLLLDSVGPYSTAWLVSLFYIIIIIIIIIMVIHAKHK